MRSRTLKPGYFKNEILGSNDPLYGTLYQGLWCMADREGRLEDRPLRICAELFPYRRGMTERRVDSMLSWLQEQKFIRRYEVDGERFIQVLTFLKHQNPHHKERPSTIPALRSNQHQPRKGAAPDQPEKGTSQPCSFSDSPFSDSLLPHSPIPSSAASAARSAIGQAVPGELASAQGRLAHRSEVAAAPRRKTAKAGEPTSAELRQKACVLAESGMAANDIAHALSQYGVTLEHVRGWIGNGAPVDAGRETQGAPA